MGKFTKEELIEKFKEGLAALEENISEYGYVVKDGHLVDEDGLLFYNEKFYSNDLDLCYSSDEDEEDNEDMVNRIIETTSLYTQWKAWKLFISALEDLK